jgi:hypothetical protein
MIRSFLFTVLAMAFASTVVCADEVKGKFAKIDGEKLTLTVDGKETTFALDKSVKVQSTNKKNNKFKDLPGGMSDLKAGDEVTLTTEKKENKEVVTKITTTAKKKKKDK